MFAGVFDEFLGEKSSLLSHARNAFDEQSPTVERTKPKVSGKGEIFVLAAMENKGLKAGVCFIEIVFFPGVSAWGAF